jgi:hypothetical protein
MSDKMQIRDVIEGGKYRSAMGNVWLRVVGGAVHLTNFYFYPSSELDLDEVVEIIDRGPIVRSHEIMDSIDLEWGD